MAIILQNNRLKIEIDEPGKPYIKSRFDWTGKITQVTLDNKHSFCTVEVPENFNPALSGKGLYNEFGITEPVGYDDCPVGGFFPKIGVGLVKRPDDGPYNFFREYEVDPFMVTITEGKSNVVFITHPKECRGYEMKLKKTLAIHEHILSIDYELQNTGTQPIHTSEYVHNFISFDHKRIGRDYTLRFPFKIDSGRFIESVNPDGVILLDDNSLNFKDNTENQYFFSPFFSDNNDNGQWELHHKSLGLGIKECVDFIPQKINVWGWKHVISPEIFFNIDIEPHQKLSWKRFYEFFYL